MEGAIAVITIRGGIGRNDLPQLEEHLVLAETNDAGAVLLDVSALSRVPTSALGQILRFADRVRSHGALVGLIGMEAVRNPVVPPGFLVGRVPVFPDVETARHEVRRRIGAVIRPA